MSAINLAPREHEMLLAIGKYINTSAVDWETLAADLNYRSAKAARDKWYPLRDKLFGKQSGSAPATPAGGTKKKGLLKRKVSDDGGDNEEATPSKKCAKKGKKANEMPVSNGDDDDDEEEEPKTNGLKVKPEPENDDSDDGGLL